MRILKEIEAAAKNCRTNLKYRLVDEEMMESETMKYNALMELVGYIKSMAWLTTETQKERVTYYIKSGFDSEATAIKFGKTKNAIQVLISESQKKLINNIGENTAEMIMAGDIENAMETVRKRTRGNQSNDYDWLALSTPSLLPKPNINRFFFIEECTSELGLLTRFSKTYVNQVFKHGSNEKLAHILGIITSNEEKHTVEKEAILHLLEGVFSNKDEEYIPLKQQIEMTYQEINEKRLFL